MVAFGSESQTALGHSPCLMALRFVSTQLLGLRKSRVSRVSPVPEALPTQFRAALSRAEGEAFGLVAAAHPRVQGLAIVEVEQTRAVRNWRRSHPDEALKSGYAILEINGHSDLESMVEELKNASEVELLMSRELTVEQKWALDTSLHRQKMKSQINACIQMANVELEMCAICHDDICHTAAQLPCGHVFHDCCARKWLIRKPRCPLCNHHLELPELEVSP